MTKPDSSALAHILFLGDQPEALLLREALAGLGELASCASGTEALSLMRESRPDLVMIDAHCMGGMVPCGDIVRSMASMGLQVLSIADGIDAENEAQELEYGVAGFIARPFNAAVVRSTVRTHLALKQKNDELAASTLECRQVQDELRRSQDLLDSLAARVPGVLYQYRVYPDGRSCCPFVSQSVRDMFGLDPGQLREDASPWFDFIHPDDQERIRLSVEESASTMQQWKQQYRFVLPGKEERWALGEAMPEKLEDGGIIWHGYIRDITEHRLMQAAIEEKEHLLRLFIENAPAAINMFDREMRCLSVSRRFLEIFRLSAEDVIGRRYYDVFPKFPEHWREFHRRCLAGETMRCEEEAVQRANGRTDWVRWEITPWYSGGEIGGLLLFFEFITERKKAQERERRLTNIYRALSAANDAIIHVESEEALFPLICRIAVEFGGMMTAGVSIPNENSQFIPVACHGEAGYVEKMVSYRTPDQPQGRGPTGTAFREGRPVVSNDFGEGGMMAPWRAITEKYGIRAIAAFPFFRGGRPYGVFVVYSGQADALDEDIVRLLNELSGNIGFALDNFDRKAGLARLSAQLIETQELERRNLAMELHDEFGQRLTMLNISLHQMRHSLVDDRAESAWRHASEEIASLTERVQAMSGSLRPPMLDRLGLEPAIQHLLRLHFSNTEIEYVFEYAGLPRKLPGPVEITVYRVVQEAITNIVRHAAATHAVIEINGGEDGDEIEVIIRDNGRGFSDDASSGRRTRLGLIGMQERVGLLGGELRVVSEKGEGTRIEVLLPLLAKTL